MTSNIPVEPERPDIDYNSEEHKEIIIEKLKTFFRPEFINRVDDIIAFRPLTKDDMIKIVDRQIALVNERLSDHRIILSLDEKAKKLKEGYLNACQPDLG